MILIVGAGASGLMAARYLLARDIPVQVLEARNRLGGRIHTVQGDFSFPVENGAEFIHGDLPLTLDLLREAGIPLLPAGGKMFRSREGRWVSRGDRFDFDGVTTLMGSLAEDMPLEAFLDRYFPEDTTTVNAVRGFAEGYDLADVRTVSTLALAREWSRDEGAQHRVKGGYGGMIDHMAAAVPDIHLQTVITDICWSPGLAIARTVSGEEFRGQAVLVTAPLGVLQQGRISFSPALPGRIDAACKLGYGTVTKVLLEFAEPFWKDTSPRAGFLMGDQPLPTWWTQAPLFDVPLLTGWWTGTRARSFGNPAGMDLLPTALRSLAGMFGRTSAELAGLLRASRADDWGLDPFSLGAYSFPTVGEEPHRALLNMPVAGTVYFAGEGLYDGDGTPGTVEAALVSGLRAAKAIEDSLKR